MSRSRIPDRLAAVCLAAGALVLGACGDEPAAPGEPIGFGRAYGIWAPGPNDTCPVEVHNAYSTVGPDRKLYPTWHPPVDPATGCSFGHEHGRDPAGSALIDDVGPIPFGYANEVLDVWDPAGMRHEDHVGHKIEWANDVPMRFEGDAAQSLFEIRCDVLAKLHQGSHSKDAFTNNLHELAYHIRCSDGTRMDVTLMSAIGTPGEFVRSCDGDVTVVVGPPTPLNSPEGGGARKIPDRLCVEQFVLVAPGLESNFGVLRESWETSNRIRREDGETLAFFNPYFQVFLPSRFYDPSQPNTVGRPIAVCYEVEANGDRAQGGACEESTANGAIPGITFDDARSAFDGAERVVDVNSNIIRNADGPEVWYTDPFGRHASTQPFPGSIRQVIAAIDNERGIDISGPTLGRDRHYGGQGVHAPN